MPRVDNAGSIGRLELLALTGSQRAASPGAQTAEHVARARDAVPVAPVEWRLRRQLIRQRVAWFHNCLPDRDDPTAGCGAEAVPACIGIGGIPPGGTRDNSAPDILV